MSSILARTCRSSFSLFFTPIAASILLNGLDPNTDAPAFALGHSVGELAAAYVSGIIDAASALRIAYENGIVAAALSGKMVHTTIPSSQLSLLPSSELHLAAINHVVVDDCMVDANSAAAEEVVSVTLCGTPDAVAAWLAKDEGAVELKPSCPWHHPAYAATEAILHWGDAKPALTFESRPLPQLVPHKATQSPESDCVFISSMSGTTEAGVDKAHWRSWLTQPVIFHSALKHLAALAGARMQTAYVVQIGPHPVLDAAITSLSASLQTEGVPLIARVSSMRRNTHPARYLREQRALLASAGLLWAPLASALISSGVLSLQLPTRTISLTTEQGVTFAEQGVTSAQIPLLARRLAPFFPGLMPHDLYRFTSIDALLAGFDDVAVDARPGLGGGGARTGLHAASMHVLGWGVALPMAVNSEDQVWQALLEQHCAISAPPTPFSEHCQHAAGYLHPPFDAVRAVAVARAAGVDAAEASVIDPQQALAIELVTRTLDHAGEDAVKLLNADRERVGVYIGAWQPPAEDATRKSAYSAIGSSLSALSARVANCFNFQGPAVTINTACSSGLVAVDTAMRDMRAGRIDYALVGGVNLIAGSPKAADAFAALKRATMLSPTARCHTFSAAADGYVRSEGGVIFLLESSAATSPSSPIPRATIAGSAVNQNTQRKPMTAVDPVAQERVVRAACHDAGIEPGALSAIEMHGTGTKLGDPVELSALARVTAKTGDGPGCTLTAAKMHFGHLESAAGPLGLLKACLMLSKRVVPAFDIDAPGLNPALEAIMASSRLEFPRALTGTPLPSGAYVGVSSFGFAGSNAHVVVQMAAHPQGQEKSRSTGVMLEDSIGNKIALESSAPTGSLLRLHGGGMVPYLADAAVSLPLEYGGALEQVWKLCCEIVGNEGARLKVDEHANLSDIGLDSLGLAELVIRLEEVYGEDCITIDDIMAQPSVKEIAACISRPPLDTAQPARIEAAPRQASVALSAPSPTNAVLAKVDVAKACSTPAAANFAPPSTQIAATTPVQDQARMARTPFAPTSHSQFSTLTSLFALYFYLPRLNLRVLSTPTTQFRCSRG